MNRRNKVWISFTAVMLTALVLVSQMRHGATLYAGSDEFLYLPLISKPFLADLTITGVEITQSVQKVNNSVPLVANRNTVVRVFAEAPVQGPINSVVVRLTAVRGGSTIGQLNSAPITIPVDATRDNFNSTVNFELPAGWLSGNVNLTASVDPDNNIGEIDESNNSLTQAMNFNDVPDLQVRIVPINYTHTGPTAPGFYPAQNVDYISDWIMRAYPIDNIAATIRSPYSFNGNLESEEGWLQIQCNTTQCYPVGGLLHEMYLLKLSDGLPEDTPIVYYAFVPINNGSTQWFYSGIAGIGWIGYRESVGLNLGIGDDTGKLAGHEIGHNLGRGHAPCGGPGDPDPSYPYVGASIGEYGLDIPNGHFWTPATAVDIMSYCEPAWISDYTYIGMYNDQMANGFAPTEATAVDALVVSAGLNEDESVSLNPSYAFTSYPSAGVVSGYQVELLDEAGQVLVSHPLRLREAEEEGISARMLTAVLPLPETTAASLRIVHGDETVATRTFSNPAAFGPHTATATRDGDAVTLNWGLVDTPAIVRYSPDGGQSWEGLGIGVTAGTFTVDATILPDGENGLFEIILGNTGNKTVLTAVMP